MGGPLPALWPVRSHDAFGYVDAEGALVVPITLRAARREREGRCAAALRPGEYGYLSPDGAWAIPPSFARADDFQGDRAVVRAAGGTGVIDRSGAPVVAPAWDQVWPESGRAWRVQRGPHVGWLTCDGEPLIEPAFTRPMGSAGLVVAADDRGMVRVALEDGRTHRLPAVDQVAWPGADTVPARVGDRWGWLGPDDRWVAPPAWGYANAFQGEVAVVRAGLGEFGLVDRGQRVIVPLRWRTLVRVGDRLWAGDPDGSYFVLDLAGRTLSGPWLKVLNLTRLFVVQGPGGFGAVDLDGRELVAPRFEALGEGGGGWLCACEGGRYGFLDPGEPGRWTIPPRFAQAGPFDGALAEVEDGRSLVDRDGRLVWTRTPPRAPRIAPAPRRAPAWAGARAMLERLAAAPPDVFGATTHRFALGDPLGAGELEALEARHGLALPPILRGFLLTVGDGPGAPGATGGAGPGHGLYAVAAALDDAPNAAAPFVPARSRAQAEADEEAVPDGLIVIGTHGCAWDYAVALNGPWADTIWQHVDPGWIPSTPAFAEVLAAHHGDHSAAQDWLWEHLDEVPVDTLADAWLEWLAAAARAAPSNSG